MLARHSLQAGRVYLPPLLQDAQQPKHDQPYADEQHQVTRRRRLDKDHADGTAQNTDHKGDGWVWLVSHR